MSNQDEFTKIAQALDAQAALTSDPLISSYLEAEAEACRELANLGDDGEVLRMLESGETSTAVVLAEETAAGSEFLTYFMTKE